MVVKICSTIDKSQISQSAFLYANRINNLLKQDVTSFLNEIQQLQYKSTKQLSQLTEPDIFSNQDKRALKQVDADSNPGDDRYSTTANMAQTGSRLTNGSFGNEANSLHNYFKLMLVAFVQTSLKDIHFMIEFFLMYDRDV